MGREIGSSLLALCLSKPQARDIDTKTRLGEERGWWSALEKPPFAPAWRKPVRDYVPLKRFHSSLTGGPHDSGRLGFASPSTYAAFIYNTLPVLSAARTRKQPTSHRSGISQIIPES